MPALLTMPSRPRTLSGILSSARHVALPEGIVSTAWPAAKAICNRIGVHFDTWQDELNRCILAKASDGEYAADTVLLSICRQAGKTYDIGAVIFADSILTPGTTTVWTAHRFKVAKETFTFLKSLAESPLLEEYIDKSKITTAAGNECIPFRNGSRIVFGARERGSIRGFANVRRLVLDEGQILTSSNMTDLAPTLNHGKNPQIIIMCTPPKESDPSEVVTDLRASCLAGEADSTLYVEFSAEDDCDPDDWAAVAQANPSFPRRTSRKAIARLRKLLPDDEDYKREGLGIWAAARSAQVIPETIWRDAADEMSMAVSSISLGIEVGPDLAWASVSVVGKRLDGHWHLELDERRDGTAWLPTYVARVMRANPSLKPPRVDVGGPIAALVEQVGNRWRFKDTRTYVQPVRVVELGAGCALLLRGLINGTVHHIMQPQMDAAVKMAGKRKLGDTGMWVFSRASARSDITPIQAAVLALIGAGSIKGAVSTERKSRRAVVLSG